MKPLLLTLMTLLLLGALVVLWLGRPVPRREPIDVTRAPEQDAAPVHDDAILGTRIEVVGEETPYEWAPAPDVIDDIVEDAAATTASILVQAVSEETLRPLAGLLIEVHPHAGLLGYGLIRSRNDLESPDSSPGVRGTTDRDGTCLIQVAAGQPLLLRATGEPPEVGVCSEPIPALPRGTEHFVEIFVPTKRIPAFVGRVVDEFAQPIAGASIRLAARDAKTVSAATEGASVYTRTGHDGLFEVDAVDSTNLVALIEHERYSPKIIGMTRGFSFASRPHVVVLRESASLSGTLATESGMAASGHLVCLTVQAAELSNESAMAAEAGLPAWSVCLAVDEEGRFAHANVPAAAEIEVTLQRDNRPVQRKERRLTLERGERRHVAWTVRRRASLTVRVRGPGGPLATAMVLLEVDVNAAPRALSYYRADAEYEFVARQHVNSRGETVFHDLPNGSYRVTAAPAPEGLGHLARKRRWRSINDERGDRTLSLQLKVGEWIEGRVVDHGGAPVPYPTIVDRDLGLSVPGDRLGQFSIGPFEERTKPTLLASAPGPYRDSEPVKVLPGERNVLIELLPGSFIMGRVISAITSKPRRATVLCYVGRRTLSTVSDADGYFLIDGIPPGSYDLVARTSDGLIGHAKTPSATRVTYTTPPTIHVGYGATVRLSSPQLTSYSLVSNRFALPWGLIYPGTVREEVVFSGSCRISSAGLGSGSKEDRQRSNRNASIRLDLEQGDVEEVLLP